MTISKKEVIVFDTEVFENCYLFTAKSLKSKKIVQLWADKPGHMEHMNKLLNNPELLWVSFNGINFDAPIMSAAAQGRDERELKQMANAIIENGMSAWMSYRDFAVEKIEFDHIDLIEVAPGVMVSLKQYEARLKMKRMIDLPFDHTHILSEEDKVLLAEYCVNDIEATEELWDSLKEQIELREHMSERYGIDLRSKSDAQMAEAIITKQLGVDRSYKPPTPATVRYKAPPFIQPKSSILQDIVCRIESHVFKINRANGAVEFPEFLTQPIILGDGVYQMGIGGLHSKHDKSVFFEATDKLALSDFDVGSFYPALIINSKLIPKGLGKEFIELYDGIRIDRLAAKKSGNSVVANTLKILLNGTFGKLGSIYSKMYAPDLMLAVTVTGQLYLLCLIEQVVELGGIVVSANTDGIVIAATPEIMSKVASTIEIYGWLTNFEFERTDYVRYAAKDVNNYFAVKVDGKVKAKGLYASAGLQKNPTNEICSRAVSNYLAKDIPVEVTILEASHDPAQFVDFTQARTVKGGGVQYERFEMVDDWYEIEPGQWTYPGSTKATVKRKSPPPPRRVGVNPTRLGRVARWYYSSDKSIEINYAASGNKVPKSEGGRACMILPDEIPADLDVERYINETIENLSNCGVVYERCF